METNVILADASLIAVVRSAIIAGSPVTWTSVPAGGSVRSTRSRTARTSRSDSGEPTVERNPTTR
jgi:hypothetical protein